MSSDEEDEQRCVPRGRSSQVISMPRDRRRAELGMQSAFLGEQIYGSTPRRDRPQYAELLQRVQHTPRIVEHAETLELHELSTAKLLLHTKVWPCPHTICPLTL